uniref:SDR family oxidoreductase n=1 Tax=Aegilops tauschii subsp. strangulata TaxID=200361 RepID=A0A453AS46_AEGTS
QEGRRGGRCERAAPTLGRHGVRVNAISPHGIATPFGLRGLAELLPEASEEELRRLVESGMSEMGGMVLEVEDIARAALYLASDEATYVNGHNLVVDGGFTVGKLIHTPDPVRSEWHGMA